MAGLQQQEQEYFPVGASVQCLTCLGEKIEGEVVAFDHGSKFLALKTSRPATGLKKSRVQQMQLVNVNLIQDVNIIQDAPPASSQAAVPNFNYAKINKRAFEEATRKRRSVCPDSVSPEGQKLYITIRKTIDDVQWDGDSILVLSAVMISPPYKPENLEVCVGEDQRQSHKNSVTRAQAQSTADHLKKIIDQFWSKQRDDNSASSARSSNDNSRNSEPPESVDAKRTSPT